MRGFLKGAIAGAMICGAGAASAQTLYLGEAGPNRGARAEALQWFADTATDLTGGSLNLDIQWGGALFKAGAALTSIADGVADLGTIIAVCFPQEMVAYGIADLPLENPDAWVGMRATDELMRSNESIRQNLADMNLVYLGTFTTSAVHIGCKGAAIRSVDDITHPDKQIFQRNRPSATVQNVADQVCSGLFAVTRCFRSVNRPWPGHMTRIFQVPATECHESGLGSRLSSALASSAVAAGQAGEIPPAAPPQASVPLTSPSMPFPTLFMNPLGPVTI